MLLSDEEMLSAEESGGSVALGEIDGECDRYFAKMDARPRMRYPSTRQTFSSSESDSCPLGEETCAEAVPLQFTLDEAMDSPDELYSKGITHESDTELDLELGAAPEVKPVDELGFIPGKP